MDAAGRVAGVLPGGARDAGVRVLVGGAGEGLVVLELAVVVGGGAIELLLEATVLCELILCLDLVVGAGPVVAVGRLAAVVGGVFVLDVDVLETPLLPSCLVGLLVGLLKPLKPALAAGVGLPVPITALPRLPGATSCFLTPLTPACTLEGRDLEAAVVVDALVGFGLACGGGGGAGCCAGCSSICLTPAARKNMP
jgi:hypothetical protein